MLQNYTAAHLHFKYEDPDKTNLGKDLVNLKLVGVVTVEMLIFFVLSFILIKLSFKGKNSLHLMKYWKSSVCFVVSKAF